MSHLKNIVKYGKKAVSTFLVANAIYIGGFLIGVNTLSMTVSPRIESHSQLESILKREREKLGMQDNISIQVNLKDGQFDGNSGKTGEDEYKIVLTGRGRNISNLRHELYHIKDGHCDDVITLSNSFGKGMKYLFYYEPKAVLYQTTGIEL